MAGVLTLTMLPAEMPVFLVVLISVLVAALAGMVYSLLLAFASINLKADQTIGGTALNLLATAIAAGLLFAMEAKGVQVRWIAAVVVLLCTFTAVMLISLFIIRKYVAYKLKPIYSIVLSRNVHTDEIFTELKDKKVENIGEELTAWADTNDREIARLKEAEHFRKVTMKVLTMQLNSIIVMDVIAYGGAALDKKTPLLRSNEAVSREAVKLLHLFDSQKDVSKVTPQVGPEQEYFLIDRELYLKREDLRLCGRALFGSKPPKGQELDDHYFGVIKPRVSGYMKELDDELWKLGVAAKTKHNEVAPPA